MIRAKFITYNSHQDQSINKNCSPWSETEPKNDQRLIQNLLVLQIDYTHHDQSLICNYSRHDYSQTSGNV